MVSSAGSPAPPRFRVKNQGVLTATGVEQLVDEYTGGGTALYEVDVDVALLALGDNITLRMYKRFTGGPWRVAYADVFVGPLPIQLIESFGLMGVGCRLTLQQTAGVMRDFPFMSYVWS